MKRTGRETCCLGCAKYGKCRQKNLCYQPKEAKRLEAAGRADCCKDCPVCRGWRGK